MKTKMTGISLAICLAIAAAGITGLTGCAGNRYKESTGEYIDDSAITGRVKDRLGDDPQYKYDDVNVTTFKGAVQLNGFVNTRAQKSRAAEIAKGVPNVKEVINNITVKE